MKLTKWIVIDSDGWSYHIQDNNLLSFDVAFAISFLPFPPYDD